MTTFDMVSGKNSLKHIIITIIIIITMMMMIIIIIIIMIIIIITIIIIIIITISGTPLYGHPLNKDTSLLLTVFLLLDPYIFSKFNPFNTDTPLIRTHFAALVC